MHQSGNNAAVNTRESAAQAENQSAPEPPTLKRFFFGDDGLRAGWSLLLFAILAGSLVMGLQTLLVHTHLIPAPHRNTTAEHMGDIPPKLIAIGDGMLVVGLTLAAAIMSWLEGRPFRRYGFKSRRFAADISLGLLWGFTCLSVLIGLLWLTHSIAFDGVALHGRPALVYAAKWAAVFLLVGLFEEFFFRGYLQYTLARGVAGIARAMDQNLRHAHAISFWVAAFLLSCVLFTLAHVGNSGETFAGILAVALAGAVFAFSLYRTGSLWWAVGFHAAWDWAQSFFYGTADSGTHSAGHFLATHPIGSALLSGSSAGPEGSLLVLPTLLLAGVIIQVTLPQRTYTVTADQQAQRDPAPHNSVAL